MVQDAVSVLTEKKVIRIVDTKEEHSVTVKTEESDKELLKKEF